MESKCSISTVTASNESDCTKQCKDKSSCIYSIWDADKPREDHDRFHLITHHPTTWNGAKTFCEAAGMRLATIYNHDDHDYVRSTTENPISVLSEKFGEYIAEQTERKIPKALVDMTSHTISVNAKEEAWIGFRSELVDGEHIMRWEYEPNLDNLLEGGFFLKHNAYNWGYGVAHSKVSKRKYPGQQKCGMMRRGMWANQDCKKEESFVCEEIGVCTMISCDVDICPIQSENETSSVAESKDVADGQGKPIETDEPPNKNNFVISNSDTTEENVDSMVDLLMYVNQNEQIM